MATQSLLSTPFDSLPNPRQVWLGTPGSNEEGLGRLALLTPAVVAAAAASEIKTGRRVCLNWDLTKLELANFSRQPCEHHIVPLLEGMAFDDIYTFNPQQSSQWDGLRHFSQLAPTPTNPSARVFYGGTTAAEITDRTSTRIGMHHWAREGVVGRGVLLDYVAYAARHNIKYSTFSDHSIPLSVLLAIAADQQLTFQRGDILFVRIGVTKEWDTDMSQDDKQVYAQSKTPQHAGIEGTTEILRWIWDEGFAAVAGDAISWEVYPIKKSYTRGHSEAGVEGVFLHEHLLAGWGMPIGEMFDLESLSKLCEEEQRWSFFVTSVPLNMPGGVSSPPNAVAIF